VCERAGEKMPNRIIKESICTSESIDQLKPFEEIVFYRLIVNCDDYGRLDARPAILKARLFPLKDIRKEQISDALLQLSLAGIVSLYVNNDRPYLQLTSWDRHQQIRSKKSKYPGPDDAGSMPIENDIKKKHLISNDINCNQKISGDNKCPRNPIQSESNPNTINTMCKADACALFESLWELYPSKKGKAQVSEKQKLQIAKIGKDEMQRAIERYKLELEKDADWRKPQNGSTFFNSGYVDYLDANYKPSHKAPKPAPTVKKNGFHNFEQRTYDYDALLKQINNNQ